MKLRYDRHHIDISHPKRRQCKPIRKTKYQGCGEWKILNERNFREGRHLCRECENRIDRERKLKYGFVDTDIKQVLSISWMK